MAARLAVHPAPCGVVADRGYNDRAVLELFAARGGRGHILNQRDREVRRSVDPAIYRRRNLVDRVFNNFSPSEDSHPDTRRPPATISPHSWSHARGFGSGIMGPHPDSKVHFTIHLGL
ncbi:MAG: hypothetical protein KDK28_13930 [Maritimibacter sp.]|nr:hypothetical protein [Maritimibacter sp.]